MDLLIPLNLFRVRYETGAGRPYSDLDKLVLRSIAEGASSLSDLQKVFMLRSRLLIEVLITLARAGWVAVDVANGGFRITAAGDETLKSGRIPQFTIIGQSEATLMMEMLTGGLVGQQEMKPYTSATLIEKDTGLKNAKRLKSEFTQLHLDPGQISDLLDRASGEWIRWIDIPRVVSHNHHWLPVSINTETGQVHNLPERWRRSLGPLLVAKAREFQGGVTQQPLAAMPDEASDWVGPQRYAETFSEEDLLLSRHDHFEVLKTAFKEARSTLFVASAFFDTSEVDPEIRNLIIQALRRGVQIYFFWGYGLRNGSLGQDEAIAWLRQLRKDSGHHGAGLRFNLQPTDSHAKFLVYDHAGEFQAFVGSCNWLSACLALKNDTREPTEATVRLRNPSVIASICRSAAGLWVLSKKGVIADAPELLRRAAKELDARASHAPQAPAKPQAASALVRIVRDQEHEALMRELLLHSKQRCLIVSNKLGAKAAIRLTPLCRSVAQPEKRVVVQYGRATPSAPKTTELDAILRPLGGSLSSLPSRHAKVLVVDHTALVTSYNFLSADPFGNFSSAKELGILIEGSPLPDLLWRAHVPDRSPTRHATQASHLTV